MPLRFHAAEPSDAGVVDDDVEAALPAGGLIHARLHGEMIADVGGKREHARIAGGDSRELCLGFLKMILADTGDGDAGPFLQQGRCDCAADAA